MRQEFAYADPIRPGYPWPMRITFPQAFWDAEQMGTGEIEADIRVAAGASLIVQLRTDTGGITRIAPRTLALSIDAEHTAKLRQATSVTFDFVREADGARRVLAGQWTFPVLNSVTQDDG